MQFSGVTLKVAKSFTWLRSLGDPWFTRPNFQASCVAQYLRVAGPTTGVAGSNPLESVNRYYLYYMKAESPIQFSVNYLLHELQALTLGSGEAKAEEENLKNAIQWRDP